MCGGICILLLVMVWYMLVICSKVIERFWLIGRLVNVLFDYWLIGGISLVFLLGRFMLVCCFNLNLWSIL